MPNPTLTSIKRAQERAEPQLDFKWIIDPASESSHSGMPDAGGVTLPTSYVESVDVPFNNIKIEGGVYAASGYSYYAGPHDISSFSINFYEDIKGSTLKYLLAWKGLIKDFKTGLYRLPSVYKKSIVVVLLDTKNDPVVKVRLKGIWPADTSNLSLNYTSIGVVAYSQLFSCDEQEIVFKK